MPNSGAVRFTRLDGSTFAWPMERVNRLRAYQNAKPPYKEWMLAEVKLLQEQLADQAEVEYVLKQLSELWLTKRT